MKRGSQGIFSKSEIVDIIIRAKNIYSYRFNRNADFHYLAGQYITVRLEINGKFIQKPFSLSSSPTEQRFIEFTKKFTGHEFSDALEAMQTGDLLDIDGPFGSFTLNEQEKKIVMLAGGIGVTPFRSMVQYSVDKGLSNDIILICSNRSEDDIIFRDDFENIMRNKQDFSIVLTCTRPGDQWTGLCGRIDSEMIQREIPDFGERLFYICGPPAMVESMRLLLKELDIPGERIMFEDFFGY